MTTIHVTGIGTITEVPDGSEIDYVVTGDCGHVSTPYTEIADAVLWKCPACREAAESALNARWLALQMESRS